MSNSYVNRQPLSLEVSSLVDPDEDYKEFSDEEVEKKAEKLGCQIWNATADMLQLDIDSEERMQLFEEQLDLVNRAQSVKETLPIVEIVKLPSRTPGHWHVVIFLAYELTHIERIMWQAIFGSDQKREALNAIRVKMGVADPIRLFRPKGEKLPRSPLDMDSSDVDDLPF